MRRLSPTLLTLLLGLASGCSKPDLPPPYSNLDTPESLLSSVQARERGRELFLEHCAICYYIIREGKQGTPMPSWKVLDEDQTWDLVAYVLSVANEAP